jgi:hypothetical protein
MIKGQKLAVCSCDYGCPCEFNAPPTRMPCEGGEAMLIEEGYFEAVRLDGIKIAGTYHWPGAVHEGGGTYQLILDPAISEEQTQALFTILSGEEQEPTTVFNIYGSTIEHEPDPVVAPIDFAFDLAARTGVVRVDGVLDIAVEPIRNPVTGAAHRALIRLPEGFEFRQAEMASADFTGAGVLNFDHKGRYGLLTEVAYGPYGLIA